MTPNLPKPRLFVDLFCGVGGFHVAASNLSLKCAFAADNDPHCQNAYEHNFGVRPYSDVSSLRARDVPDHTLLCAGFPCQPFSIIGKQRGLNDPRGLLYRHIIRILRVKKPPAVVLENVKQLSTHNKGETLNLIIQDLQNLGYQVHWRVLNALDFGLPQKRERTIIVALGNPSSSFQWPKPHASMKPLADVLETNPHPRYFASAHIQARRRAAHTQRSPYPTVWHENKGGNVSSHPFSCALRAGASYNYLLVNGERRLTPREMLRLQGFPDSFRIVCSDHQTRKQAGNAVPVPLAQDVIKSALHALDASRENPSRAA